MNTLLILATFTILVILGTILSNLVPKIPAAVFQIILGAIFVLLPIPLEFTFNSQAFLLLVIAPLLFTDAYKSSRTNLWIYRRPILLMAIALVLFSTIVVGGIIYLIIPAMPLSVSFALAAILSPTDAVAVKSIVKDLKLPKGLMPILEGESLLNDAAGLVSFNIALVAILTNTFSLAKATQDFIFVALGGAIFGVVLGIALVFIKKFLGILVGEEANVLVIFQLMTPIFVYFCAEHVHVSGIVAVIMTGILYNLEKDLYQHKWLNSKTTLLIESSQKTFGYALNGYVFVLLGYLLPEVYMNVVRKPELDDFLVSLYIVAITLALMVTRFIFVYVFYKHFQAHTYASTKKIIKVFIQRKLDVGEFSRLRYCIIATLSGIHGTITMAVSLLIPVFLNNGQLFPLRNTIIFIASGVVLLSIAIGIIFLPLALNTEEDQAHYLETQAIRERIIKQAITKLKEHYRDGSNTKRQIATAMVIKDLQAQEVMVRKNPTYLQREIHKIYNEVLREENKQIRKWQEEQNLSKPTLQVIKLMQLRRTKLLNYSMFNQIILLARITFNESYFKRLSAKYYFKNKILVKSSTDHQEKFRQELNEIKENLPQIHENINKIAIEKIKVLRNEKNSLATDIVCDVYKNFAVTYFTVYVLNESYNEELKEVQAEAIQIQKDKVMYLKKSNQITVEDANLMLKELNYNESLIFAEE